EPVARRVIAGGPRGERRRVVGVVGGDGVRCGDREERGEGEHDWWYHARGGVRMHARILVAVAALGAQIEAPPVARTVDVVDDAFGVKVSDPYRWMEGTDNAETLAYLKAQGAYAD